MLPVVMEELQKDMLLVFYNIQVVCLVFKQMKSFVVKSKIIWRLYLLKYWLFIVVGSFKCTPHYSPLVENCNLLITGFPCL